MPLDRIFRLKSGFHKHHRLVKSISQIPFAFRYQGFNSLKVQARGGMPVAFADFEIRKVKNEEAMKTIMYKHKGFVLHKTPKAPDAEFPIAHCNSPKMTSYGPIPTLASPSCMLVNQEYISHAKECLEAGLSMRRPLREMFQLHSFNLPKSFRKAVARVKINIGYFRMNYAIMVLLILFLSLLWHPISLIVFIAMMAVWLLLYFLRDEPLVIFGRLITDCVVLIMLAVVTIVVLLLMHTTTNILVSLLVGVVVVLIHAIMRKADDLFADEEAAEGLLRSSGGPSSS